MPSTSKLLSAHDRAGPLRGGGQCKLTYASGESGTGRGSIYGDEHRPVSPRGELRLGCEHAPRSKALEVQLAGAVRGFAVGWDGVPP